MTSWSFAVSASFRENFHVLFNRSVCNWSAVPSAAGTWFVDKMSKDDLRVGIGLISLVQTTRLTDKNNDGGGTPFLDQT